MAFARSFLVGLFIFSVVVALSSCRSATGDVDVDEVPSAPALVSLEGGPGYVDLVWQHDGEGTTSYAVYRAQVVEAEAQGALVNEGDGAVVAAEVVQHSNLFVSAVAWQRVGEASESERSFRDATASEEASYYYAVAARDEAGRESPLPEPSGDAVRAEPIGGPIGANPDPERFVAVIVRNFLGNAVAGARVSVTILKTDGSGSSLGNNRLVTDAGGVVVMEEFDTWPFGPGAYDVAVLVDYDGLSPGAVFATFEGLELPGTIDIDPLSDAFVPVAFTLSDAGEEVLGSVQPSATFDDLVYRPVGFLRMQKGTVRMMPGSYRVLVTQSEAPNAFALSVPLEVALDSRFDFDASAVEDIVTLNAPFDVAGVDGQLAHYNWVPKRMDGWSGGVSFGIRTGTARLSPGQYQIYSTAHIDDGSGTVWPYSLRPSLNSQTIDLDMTTSGATYVHEFGGAAAVRVVHNPARQWSAPIRESYTVGDRVYIAARFFDAYENYVQAFTNYSLACELAIDDPNGVPVLSVSGKWFDLLRSSSEAASWLVGDGAVAGVYTAGVRCDLGPYAHSVAGETTFAVEAP